MGSPRSLAMPLFFASVLLLSALACNAPPASAPASPAQRSTAALSPSTAGAPLLVVTATAITLDGVLVGDPRAIEATHRAMRIDDLFARLNQQRAAAPEKTAELWFDARDAGALAAVSALTTATFAKYVNIHVRTRDGWVGGEWDAMLPRADAPPPHRRLIVSVDGERAAVTWQSDDVCDAVPENAHIALRDLDGYLSSTCRDASPCVDIGQVLLDSALPFSTAADALAIVQRHAGTGFVFAVRAFTAAVTAPPERTCGEKITRGGGRLPPEVVQRIVRANFDRMRSCYEAGLARDPKLAGKVVIKMIIDRRGNATDAVIVDATTSTAAGPTPLAETHSPTTMPDRAVAACVRDVFASLTFPKPVNGSVTVVYPIAFSPESGTDK